MAFVNRELSFSVNPIFQINLFDITKIYNWKKKKKTWINHEIRKQKFYYYCYYYYYLIFFRRIINILRWKEKIGLFKKNIEPVFIYLEIGIITKIRIRYIYSYNYEVSKKDVNFQYTTFIQEKTIRKT